MDLYVFSMVKIKRKESTLKGSKVGNVNGFT